MVGLGLTDHPQDDLVPTARMVEAHDRLDVHELARNGLLTPGLQAKIGEKGSLLSVHEAGNLEIDGQPIRVAWHKALPLRVFVCPVCERDCYRLHEVGDVWACRLCHRLTYQSRHRHRTIPGFARVLYLRRRVGASPILFSPIKAKRRNATRYWRLVLEIRHIEAALVGHLRADVNDVLERRENARRSGAGRDCS
jgi:hypothetical protein